MVKYIVMLVLVALVAGSLAVILVLFLRRLRKIEEELWGKKK